MNYSTPSGLISTPLKFNKVPVPSKVYFKRVEVANRADADAIIGYGTQVNDVVLYNLNTGTSAVTPATGALGADGGFIITADKPFNCVKFQITTGTTTQGDIFFNDDVVIEDGSDDFLIITPDLTSTGEEVLLTSSQNAGTVSDATDISNGWPEGKYAMKFLITDALTATIDVANIYTYAEVSSDTLLIDEPHIQLDAGADLVVISSAATATNTVSHITTR